MDNSLEGLELKPVKGLYYSDDEGLIIVLEDGKVMKHTFWVSPDLYGEQDFVVDMGWRELSKESDDDI